MVIMHSRPVTGSSHLSTCCPSCSSKSCKSRLLNLGYGTGRSALHRPKACVLVFQVAHAPQELTSAMGLPSGLLIRQPWLELIPPKREQPLLLAGLRGCGRGERLGPRGRLPVSHPIGQRGPWGSAVPLHVLTGWRPVPSSSAHQVVGVKPV